MILTFLLIVLTIIAHPQANSWRGIVPLHSTRADVEKILGPPTPDSKAMDAADYKTENERIFVLYSTGPCDVQPSNGWNAPRGIVLRISVEPNTKPKFADLRLDESKYDRRPDGDYLDSTSYVDEEDGISITVNTAQGVVTSISYWPTSKQNHLRCSAPAEDPYQFSGFLPHKFAEYSHISPARERKQLGGFAKLLRRFISTQGHIIAYAGKRAHPGEAERLLKRAKTYLVNNRGINAARLITIDGGYRERWTVELYLVPPGVTPPAPSPNLAPKKP
jgi:hypothetical protein